jgi:O-antigen/teichoic acid export membrane protein
MWNLLSAFTLGVSGIIVNVTIGDIYHVDGLGLFSQAVASYMIISILAAFGIQTSIIKSTAELVEDQDKLNQSITGALLSIFLTSSFVTIIALLFLFLTDGFFKNKEVAILLQYMLSGLVLFSLNKVLMGFLNGLRSMKFYALIQSARWVILLLLILLLSLGKQKLNIVVLSFPLTELFVLCLVFAYSRKYFRIDFRNLKPWMRTHLLFGGQSVLIDSVSELNAQISIILIGYFLTDRDAGNYSLAFSITRGFWMITSIIQLNFNPIIANLWAQGRLQDLKQYFLQIKKVTLLIMIPLLLVAFFLYPIFIHIFMTNSSSYEPSIPVFSILLFGVAVFSSYYSVGAMLTMTGHQAEALKLLLLMLFINVSTSIFFIHWLQLIGAAIATSIYYIALTVLLVVFIRKKTGFQI